MHQTDVSFKQSRRRKKKVEPDEEDDNDSSVTKSIPSLDSGAASDLICKRSTPLPAKPTRKPALPWRSLAARNEREAFIKFYEKVNQTRDVITPEASITSQVEVALIECPDVSVHGSESPCIEEHSSQDIVAQPSLPARHCPQTWQLCQQESKSDSLEPARSYLASPSNAAPLLASEEASPNLRSVTRSSLEATSSSPVYVRRAADIPERGIAAALSSSQLNSSSGVGSPSARDDGIAFDVQHVAEFDAASAQSPACVCLCTPPGRIHMCHEQDLPGATTPLGQASAWSSSRTVSMDTTQPGPGILSVSKESVSKGKRSPSPVPPDVLKAHSSEQPNACRLRSPFASMGAQPLSAVVICNIEPAPGTSDAAGTPFHDVTHTASPAEANQDNTTPSAVSAASDRASLGTANSAAPIPYPCAPPGETLHASLRCMTPHLTDTSTDTPASHSGPIVHSSRITACSLQQCSEAQKGSPRSSCADTASAAALDGLKKPASACMHSVHRAEDVFATPQLSVSLGEGSPRVPLGSASPTSKVSGPSGSTAGVTAAVAAEADHEPLQPGLSLWGRASHMPSERRRAKARASVSYARRSSMSLSALKTPCGALLCPLALPAARLGPGLTCGEATPRATDAGAAEVVSVCLNGPPEHTSQIEHVLQACGQEAVGDFTECMDRRYGGAVIKKLGEGTFKEVYLCGNDVVSVIPIEGHIKINDDEQPSAQQILPELVAHTQLSRLRQPTAPCGDPSGLASQCSAFVDVMGCMLLQGKYYLPFDKAWKHFKETDPEAENEDPTNLPQDQLFLILISENGGRTLEHVPLYSFEEAKSIMLQVTLALAVAETCHEFEHRDLHWGNILIQSVDKENEVQSFHLDGKQYMVNSHGNKVCIIDFTLCRLTSPEGEILASDLDDLEWLFDLESNFQGDAYRRMKTVAEKVWKRQAHPKLCWEHFTPGTNVTWIEYLCGQLREIVFIKERSGELSRLEMKKKEEQSWEAFRKACRSDRYGSSCKNLLKHPFFKSALIK